MSTPEKRFELEVLLRQRKWWVVENHPDSIPLVQAQHDKLAVLKAELGVTDEAQFLREQEAAR